MNNVTQKPRIIFLGLCGATSQLVNDWIVDASNQVLIYPVYDTTQDTNKELDIKVAGDEYIAFLQALAHGNNVTVGDALATLNNQTQTDMKTYKVVFKTENNGIPMVWSWAAYGNTNLTFNPPLH